ncbi:MAG TPA: ATP-binding cassette domain-containing protein [Actinocrinis sp.]|nr:ATP-binding cassette domain-containing protein [Actinocrinis sp.]
MRCSEVRVRYGGIEVLHGVGLAVPFGAVTALVGPNGAGKSTLLNWCAGAASTATSAGGRLELTRTAASEPLADATSWSATRRAASGLRVVRSGVNVFQSLTVKENLLAGGEPERGPESALALFPELEPLLSQRAATLSGGQRQLLAIATALGSRWRVLLVDEPVQGIAPELADRVFGALAAAITPDRAVLIADPVTHRAAAVADFVWRLERGRIVFAGEAAELARGSSPDTPLGCV